MASSAELREAREDIKHWATLLTHHLKTRDVVAEGAEDGLYTEKNLADAQALVDEAHTNLSEASKRFTDVIYNRIESV